MAKSIIGGKMLCRCMYWKVIGRDKLHKNDAAYETHGFYLMFHSLYDPLKILLVCCT